ncbi:MAG TPA: hypothetical protein VK253_00055 [Candidatus Binatia bacterium]|nr:hypothetical protein [Candidatus Binatia bacterium]
MVGADDLLDLENPFILSFFLFISTFAMLHFRIFLFGCCWSFVCTTSFFGCVESSVFCLGCFLGLFGYCSGCGCVFSTSVVVEIEMIVDLEEKNPHKTPNMLYLTAKIY